MAKAAKKKATKTVTRTAKVVTKNRPQQLDARFAVALKKYQGADQLTEAKTAATEVFNGLVKEGSILAVPNFTIVRTPNQKNVVAFL